MKSVYFLIIGFFLSITITAQTGKISGKVISGSSGQALQSASITLIEKSKTIIADQNGNFSFSQLAPGKYSINCSNVSYSAKIVEEIIVKSNENTTITISLQEKKTNDQEIIISTPRVKAARESIASILIAQKNSANVSDGISAESIRKTPDRSTSDVLKRVSGASIQDDRFAIIRGLNDRYNAAFINGAPLPSTESDRKAFAFDIFPAAILDNLIIYKTATADKTGDFAGGIIDISTKSVIPKNFTTISFSVAYNPLITGRERFLSENKGKTDWIGISDDSRRIPAGVPSPAEIRDLSFTDQGKLAKLFKHYKWGIKQSNTIPDVNFQISKGFNIERKQKEFFGALFSINYKRSFTFNQGSRDVFAADPMSTRISKVEDSVYNDEVIFAALGNLSVKIDNRNNIGWKNNLSINTDNRLIKRIYAPDFQNEPNNGFKDAVRWFTSNLIFSSQLYGEHQIGTKKTKINWLASYSKVTREIPNFARTSYFYDYNNPGGQTSLVVPERPSQLFGSGTMFSTKTDENIKSIKVDISQPYTFMKNSQNLLKIGVGFQSRDRIFTSNLLGFAPYNSGSVQHDYSLESLPENQVFLPENLGLLASGKGGFLLREGNSPNANYDASSTTAHVYIMNDQRFFTKFRLIYGLRMETFRQKLFSPGESVGVPPATIDSIVTDFLPSVNLVYALTSKTNLRLSYSQTLNRPEFRELAPFVFYDYASQFSINGQTNLQRAKIKNYDLRYEFFPGKAQLFSMSAFYKDFTNPIEFFRIPDLQSQAFYTNVASATAYGVEAEFRTLISTLFGIKNEHSFLNKLTLSANGALIKSNVVVGRLFNVDPDKLATKRALQGQSPYIINSSLSFNDENTGFSSTLSVNRVGDRVSIAGNYIDFDIYEKARTVMDFQVAKFFLNNKLELKFTARDILAQNIVFYNDVDRDTKFSKSDNYFSSFNAPKVFTFSATYKF